MDQQTVHRKPGFAQFIITICPLTDLEKAGNLRLGQGTLLPQCTNTFCALYFITSLISYHRVYYSIDF